MSKQSCSKSSKTQREPISVFKYTTPSIPDLRYFHRGLCCLSTDSQLKLNYVNIPLFRFMSFIVVIKHIRDRSTDHIEADGVWFDVIKGNPSIASVQDYLFDYSTSISNFEYDTTTKSGFFVDLNFEFSVGQSIEHNTTFTQRTASIIETTMALLWKHGFVCMGLNAADETVLIVDLPFRKNIQVYKCGDNFADKCASLDI